MGFLKVWFVRRWKYTIDGHFKEQMCAYIPRTHTGTDIC